MPNQQLIEYIKQAKASGMNDADIRAALLSAGWQGPDIEEALAISSVVSQASTTSHSSKLIVAIVSLVAVFLLAGGGFAYWYFVYEPAQEESIQNILAKDDEMIVEEMQQPILYELTPDGVPAQPPQTGSIVKKVKKLSQYYKKIDQDMYSVDISDVDMSTWQNTSFFNSTYKLPKDGPSPCWYAQGGTINSVTYGCGILTYLSVYYMSENEFQTKILTKKPIQKITIMLNEKSYDGYLSAGSSGNLFYWTVKDNNNVLVFAVEQNLLAKESLERDKNKLKTFVPAMVSTVTFSETMKEIKIN